MVGLGEMEKGREEAVKGPGFTPKSKQPFNESHFVPGPESGPGLGLEKESSFVMEVLPGGFVLPCFTWEKTAQASSYHRQQLQGDRPRGSVGLQSLCSFRAP